MPFRLEFSERLSQPFRAVLYGITPAYWGFPYDKIPGDRDVEPHDNFIKKCLIFTNRCLILPIPRKQYQTLLILATTILPSIAHSAIPDRTIVNWVATNTENAPGQLFTSCVDGNSDAHDCIVELIHDSKRDVIMRLPIAPSSLSFTDNTYIAKSPCGTGCSIAYYYRAGRGQSGPYSVVLAEDLENDLVLVVQGKSAFVQKLFEHDAPTEFISLPPNQNEDLLQDIESAVIEKGVLSMRISRDGESPVDIQKTFDH